MTPSRQMGGIFSWVGDSFHAIFGGGGTPAPTADQIASSVAADIYGNGAVAPPAPAIIPVATNPQGELLLVGAAAVGLLLLFGHKKAS